MRALWSILGWTSVVLGVAGVILPIVPTTPFVLLSAGCFAKSSPKTRDWMLRHPKLGPLISDWEARGAIARKAKIRALPIIVVVFGLSMWSVHPKLPLQLMLLAVGSILILFIASRPD